MTPRRRRLALIAGGLCVLGVAAALVLYAFRTNLVFFYTPSQVAAGAMPRDRAFRVGGLVKPGSLERREMTVRFVVTDTAQEVRVAYTGILPDLFKEGKGVVAQGKLGGDGVFVAAEVLAKHDENYMPPEAKHAVDQAHKAANTHETMNMNQPQPFRPQPYCPKPYCPNSCCPKSVILP